MNTKDKIQKFARELDEGLPLKHPSCWNESAESLELLELGKALAGQDFSVSHRTAVLSKVQSSTHFKQEVTNMKIKSSFRRPVMIMASILIAGGLSISFVKPSFAEELFGRVLQKINLGNIIASAKDPNVAPPFPEEWKGKLFDKDGTVITSFTKKLGEVYNADGEQIVNFDGDKLITKSEQEQRDKEAAARILAVKSQAELDKYALFKVKLPKYLPEGFAFDHGEFSKSEEGVNGKYLDLFFTSEHKGQSIKMQFRYSDKETAYEMSTSGKMEKVKVNGAEAVMMNDRTLDWEADGVLYGIATHGLERSEVLKIAESIR
ncbi:hypothetical protein PAECIP111892_04325 [Paenibacillus auburnensis]|uniref:DUF4367 domain-containing protein n=1 Tax=Paenibacillus auburnensis TaxID=2905649 RepID=A0ABM9CL75_9BACL|nr:DUF4367 domain-containing protein [Paenibacillus auburnensis]CAH1216472.1 hypothetical protein PAECIP111892_04325 [Paenibacillus auburnensis]